MHGTREKLLAPVSGTRNMGGELGSCAMGLKRASEPRNMQRRVVGMRCKLSGDALMTVIM